MGNKNIKPEEKITSKTPNQKPDVHHGLDKDAPDKRNPSYKGAPEDSKKDKGGYDKKPMFDEFKEKKN